MALRSFAPLAATLLALTLGACSSGGGMLSAGLTQRMDQPGATLNRAESLGIVNQLRNASGVSPLQADSALDATAQALAAQYAATGKSPGMPAGMVGLRTSAGYQNFAETFSGWRNSPPDAAVLTDRNATRGGLGVAYDPNSTYGVYWVILLDD